MWKSHERKHVRTVPGYGKINVPDVIRLRVIPHNELRSNLEDSTLEQVTGGDSTVPDVIPLIPEAFPQ